VGQKYEIKENNIISFEMVAVFYYKGCEVTLKKYNNITVIKMVGLSDIGNLLIGSQTFMKKIGYELLIKYLKSERKNIEKVYRTVANKEYGNDDKFSFKDI